MKRVFLLLVAVSCALICGCSSPKLDIGVYRAGSDREDFIFAYEDMIFLQIKSPECAEGSLEYWNWAGKYSIDEDGRILFDMDTPTRKRWNLYYNFLHKSGGVVVNDLYNNSGFLLRYQTPKRRSGSYSRLRPVGSTGVDPVYAPLPREQ